MTLCGKRKVKHVIMGERRQYRFPSTVSHNSGIAKSIYEDFRASSENAAIDNAWSSSRNTYPIDSVQELSENLSGFHLNLLENEGKLRKKCRRNSKRIRQHIKLLSQPKYLIRKYSNPEDKKNSEIDLTPLKPNRFREVTPRLLQLAEPKIWNPIPSNSLGRIPEKALRATASKRILELAKPKKIPEPVFAAEKVEKNTSKAKHKNSNSSDTRKKLFVLKGSSGATLSQVLHNFLGKVYMGPFDE